MNPLDIIRWQYLALHERAIEIGLQTDNIQIYLRSEVKAALGLDDTLVISYGSLVCNVPIITDDDILETREGDMFQSDFYIYDPNWAEIE